MSAAPRAPTRRQPARPGQHFLLSKAARSLPLATVFRMTELQAFKAFRKARWPDSGGAIPWCPHCGTEGGYQMKAATGQKFSNRFRCKQEGCRRDFSVTSGTILANRKLPFRTILQAIALSTQSAKGKAALQLSRELDVQYKTAWVLSHKLREAVAAEREAMRLDGVVEMDGMYIGGHHRPENKREDRVDRRKLVNEKRQCVMALRQRKGRILATVVPGEQRDAAFDLVRRHVQGPAELVADEAPGYDDLIALFPMRRNNHGQAYVVEAGSSTNQAESFFTRVRRSAHGVHHRVAGIYLDWYVSDLARREDFRRMRTQDQANGMLSTALAHGPSRNISGYWQGNKPPGPLGWSPPDGDGSPRPPRPRRADDDDDMHEPRRRGRAIMDAVRAAQRKLKG